MKQLKKNILKLNPPQVLESTHQKWKLKQTLLEIGQRRNISFGGLITERSHYKAVDSAAITRNNTAINIAKPLQVTLEWDGREVVQGIDDGGDTVINIIIPIQKTKTILFK